MIYCKKINKKARQFFYLSIVLNLFACTHPIKKKANNTHTQTININSSKKLDSFITAPCAVLVYPSLHKIDSMKRESDSTDFYTTADDNQYYMGTSIEYLDSVKARRIVKDSEGVIAFKTNAGEIFKMRLDTLYWGIILFNGKSKPISADITIIKNDYNTYMKK